LELARAKLHNGQVIRYFPEKKLGEGTEKEFFATEDEHVVIGFYIGQDESEDPERLKRLTRIIEKFNPTLDTDTGDFWRKHFCWPTAIVSEPRMGLLAPRFPSEYYFSDNKGEQKGKWFSKQGLLKKLSAEERGTWLSRIQICRQLARSIGRMHMAGLAHSDLSGNNVLMDPSGGTCMVIDIDSLVVPSVFPSKVLGTRGYMAPEVVATSLLPLKHLDKELPNIRTDLHSLAVIIYETLLLRHPLIGKKIYDENPETDDLLRFGEKAIFIEHPDDPSNRPGSLNAPFHILGPHLVPLFQSAFVDGLHDPDRRPTAYEWEKALTYTADILYPCGDDNCWHGWFVCQRGSDLECPFCGWKPSHKVPMMNLFRKHGAGQYWSEKRYITMWDKKALYPWHTRSDIPYSADMWDHAESKGRFELRDDHVWMLSNESDERMIGSAWEGIFPGKSMEISENKMILLSNHSKGRLAVFEFSG